MPTPGSNLLTTALGIICRESFDYIQFTGRTTNAIGYDERTYAEPVTITGSVQAVDRSHYTDNGLDFSKRHIQIWTDTNVEDLYRARSGDQIQWNGNRYEVLSETDWHPIDGWNNFIAVEVPTP